jgi:hypothetical protein
MDDSENNQYSPATITKTEKKNSITSFHGKVKIFDRFATNKQITLNVKKENHYCKKERKNKHRTWKIFEKKYRYKNICD